MKKTLLAAALLCSVGLVANAQSAMPQKRICASGDIYKQMLKDDPQFAENQRQLESFTQKFIQNGGANAVASKTGTYIYTIPVVVHVVYNTTAQNISDAQIASQITVLNQDYQKLNADVGQVPSVWTSLVANCQIRFCLASIDPTGAPTTGIRRVKTTTTAFSTNNNVKYTSKGGDDAWDSKSYLNLWVCKLSGGVLGYAQFPGGKAATDGVVITYTGFGTTGTAAAPYNKGRTATHEIGHWLNLRHIWGDDNGACTGSDLVGDTPNQASEHYGCPTFPKVTCSNGPNGDMFMNYMDYTDDKCMYMFTNGQKDRMYATLQSGGSRYSVTVSGKCGAQPAAKVNSTVSAVLNIIPNPIVSGIATVSYKLQNTASVQLVISDMYGNTVSTINLGTQTAGSYHMQPGELSQVKNGLYVMKLMTDDVEIATARFMVSR